MLQTRSVQASLSQRSKALELVPGAGVTTEKFPFRLLQGTCQGTTQQNRRQQSARLAPIACLSLSSHHQGAPQRLHIAPSSPSDASRLPNSNGSPQEAASDPALRTAGSGVQVPPGELKADRVVHFPSCYTLYLNPALFLFPAFLNIYIRFLGINPHLSSL